MKNNKLKKLMESIKEREQRMIGIIEGVPEIHREILLYCNTHTKEEVLMEYPEHADFIEKIVF